MGEEEEGEEKAEETENEELHEHWNSSASFIKARPTAVQCASLFFLEPDEERRSIWRRKRKRMRKRNRMRKKGKMGR